MTRSELSRGEFLANADHTLLAPGTTAAELAGFLASAVELGVGRVCLSPSLVPAARRTLGELAERAGEAGAPVSTPGIVTVVGFPSGAHRAEAKAAEARLAVADGADEIDVVANRGLARAGAWAELEAELRAVREACAGSVLKVILETAALADDEIAGACRAAEAAGADFVKTSTGFDPAGGASVHAVRLMDETVGGRLGVKASGGIRTADAVRELWLAGATRFGVSGTAAILESWDGADRGEGAADPGAPGASAY